MNIKKIISKIFEIIGFSITIGSILFVGFILLSLFQSPILLYELNHTILWIELFLVFWSLTYLIIKFKTELWN